MNKSSKEKYWDRYSERNYFNKSRLDKEISYYNTLFQCFDCNTRELTAIEIGAGHGIHTKIFVNSFKKYFATEPNDSLYGLLENLKTDKYNNLHTIQCGCEDFEIAGKKQFDFVIFTNSFQFTDHVICKQKIDEILKINGYLLIILPNEPFYQNNLIKDNKYMHRWRLQLIRTIKFLMKIENYQLLHILGKEYFFKKIN